MPKRQVLISIIGAPGSGKGVQAGLLSFKYGFVVEETSRIIEDVLFSPEAPETVREEGQVFQVEKEKEKFEKGELCDPIFVWHFVKERIRQDWDKGYNIVFQGSPRTLPEAERFYALGEELFSKENLFTFWLHIKVEDSIFRNSHRRICSLVRHPILWLEDNHDLRYCPLDGSELVKREIDNPEIITERFKIYQEETLPVLSWLQEKGYKVCEIDGRNTPSEVFAEIERVLKCEGIV